MTTRTTIIAEAGVNHNGDIQLAKELIDVSAASGADYVKFQSFSALRQTTQTARKADYQTQNVGSDTSQQEMLRQLELTEDMLKELMAYCDLKNMKIFSTGFDIESVDLLANLGQKFFKIPSGEINNLPYLRHVGQLGKPILLSTGMSTLGDIEAAIDVLEQAGTSRDHLTVLHCTTEYPAPMHEVNLQAMQCIQSAFGVAVGYSDHTRGIEIAIAAVAMGASVIEKHFTLDRGLPGPDHKASLEPAELDAMVTAIRNTELALGDGIKRVTSSELRNRSVARKSLVASRAIKAGDVFTPQNLVIKRPGTGISPMRGDEALGKKAQRDFVADELIDV